MKFALPIGALLGAVALSFAPPAAAAVTLDVQGGVLMGASGVVVDGQTYSVQFKDGTCGSVFGGCDQTSDFTFQTEASALAAGQALLDFVLINSDAGLFDTKPGLTNGCNFGFPADTCRIFIPYDPTLPSIVEVTNTFALTTGDVAFATIGPPHGEDTTNQEQKTWAVWTPGGGSGEDPDGGGAVPEPATWAMMILGMGFVGAAMRRSRRQTHHPRRA